MKKVAVVRSKPIPSNNASPPSPVNQPTTLPPQSTISPVFQRRRTRTDATAPSSPSPTHAVPPHQQSPLLPRGGARKHKSLPQSPRTTNNTTNAGVAGGTSPQYGLIAAKKPPAKPPSDKQHNVVDQRKLPVSNPYQSLGARNAKLIDNDAKSIANASDTTPRAGSTLNSSSTSQYQSLGARDTKMIDNDAAAAIASSADGGDDVNFDDIDRSNYGDFIFGISSSFYQYFDSCNCNCLFHCFKVNCQVK